MRVRLAYWWNGFLPGEVVEVDDATGRRLQHNGRVAAVLPEPAPDPEPAPQVRRSRARRSGSDSTTTTADDDS